MTGILRWVVVAIVVVHGLIHLLGAAKGLGWADVPQLKQPVSHLGGVCWLAASVLLIVTGLLIAANSPSWWWLVAAVAVIVSQVMIITSWSDAKAGTLANVIVLLAAVYGFASLGPMSFRAEWNQDASAALRTAASTSDLVDDDDLADLPDPLVRYLRRSAVVGKPKVTNFHAHVSGRIRNGPDDAWMPFTGEQVNTFGPDPQRFFFISATRSGLPVDIFHVYDHGSATMRGRLLSLVPVVNASGPDMDRSETVTIFNDLVLFAPGALLDAPVRWTAIDDSRVRGEFTNGSETVGAELTFDAAGDLVDFSSDDRSRASDDGSSFTPLRWNTPVNEYRNIDGRRVVVNGDGKWYAPEPEGHYAYVEFGIDDITYNVDEGALG